MRLIANILSIAFHPLLMVTYGVALAFASTYLAVYPLQMKLLILSGVFLMTAVVPAIFIFLLVKYGNAGDYALTNRRVRTLPYLLYVASIVACAFFLLRMLLPFWLVVILFGTAAVMLIAMGINFRWKISAHMIGIGGLIGGIMGIAQIYALNPWRGHRVSDSRLFGNVPPDSAKAYAGTGLCRFWIRIYRYLYIFIIKLFLFFHLKHLKYEFSYRCKVHKGS